MVIYMFNKYLISNINNKEVIYLYLNNRYEISDDLYIVKNNKIINNSVRNYLKNMGINYKNKDIYLVVNDMIVAKLNSKLLSDKLNYIEYIRYGKESINESLDVNIHPSLKFIDLTRSNGIIERVKLNNYLLNVIIKEMPNVMEIEALKAQAVISRSYVFRQLENNKKINEFNELLIYKNKEDLKRILLGDFDHYMSLVKSAIIETNNEVIKYNDSIIDCYTHYCNDGKTEDSKNILKNNIDYLVSVYSPEKDNGLLRYRRIGNKHLSIILGIDIDKNTRVSIIERTSGDNIKSIMFNDKVYDGFELAKKLSLISYNYFIIIEDNYTWFVTKGCGINLGLSKMGAIELAKKGYNYKQILTHYFQNTVVKKIS